MPFQALYYPSWNPPVSWVRSTLLVFDQIQVIRPTEVEDPRYHVGNRAVFDLLPHTFGEIRKTHYEMTLDPQNREILISTLDFIANQKKMPSPKKLVLRYDLSGDVSVPGFVFLHLSKIPSFVKAALEQRGLIHLLAEKVLRESGHLDGFRVVQEDASNVILALIADHYGKASALRTVTDERLGYLNVALNQNMARRRDTAAMNLATAILRFQIPMTIEQLSPKQYVSLRQRYDDLREPFQHAVRTICDDNLLAGIESRRQFEDAVHNAAREFSLGVDRLMKSSFAVRFGKWAPMSFGIMSSVCQLTASVTAVIGVGVDCLLKIYAGLAENVPPTEIHSAQRLMATLRRELVSPLLMRRIVLP
jgi:hypothetical protein